MPSGLGSKQMTIPFEFTIDGPPVSLNAKTSSKNKWIGVVNKAAASSWKPRPEVDRELALAVAINYFCYDAWPDRRHSLDVDNVPKFIIDGLKGVVFTDDKQIVDVECYRRNLYDDLRLVDPISRLVTHVSGTDPFLHIWITPANSLEVIL